MSNRLDGIIPSLGSIIKHASKKVDVVLVGDHTINERVHEHFGSRINHFISLTVDDVTIDLRNNGINPIWTWPEWHTSITDPYWKNDNTIHVADWDNLMTHAHELNHLRFYLPDLSIFQNKGYLYFIDDDILVRKDLGPVGDDIIQNLPVDKGIVTPCNIWRWDPKCQHFNFHDQTDLILNSPSLYGDMNICETKYEQHCYPKSYLRFIRDVLPPNGSKEKVWNFGFTLIALNNWRKIKLRDRYENVMKKSYKQHVFPETSLTFGLGAAYLAFAGAVQCWDESKMIVRDGLGFIDFDRFEASFGKGFFDTVDVAHYTGPEKPWVPYSKVDLPALQPWLDAMVEEQLPLPEQLPIEPTKNLFVILASDRTGVQWIMDTLDNHPQICASGETTKPESGFMSDALLPTGLSWYPTCSVKLGCTFAFITKALDELLRDSMQHGTVQRSAIIPRRCMADYDPVAVHDPYAEHLQRLCNFIRRLKGNHTSAAIGRVWVEAFVNEDKDLLGCKCPRGSVAKGIKIQPEWLTYQNFPDRYSGPPKLELDDSLVHGSKMIRLKRRNLWARYKSMALAKQSGLYHIQSAEEKQFQVNSTEKIKIPIEDLVWTINHMANIDKFGDNWAREHASDVLWIDYEDCRDKTAENFKKIFDFVGANTTFPESMMNNKKFDSLFADLHLDESLDNIENSAAVKEALIANGWGHYVGVDSYNEIQLLVYDDTNTLAKSHKVPGINATVYGQDKNSFMGGTKFSSAIPLLRSMPPSTLIVMADGRDFLINFPNGADNLRYDAISKFRQSFDELTKYHTKSVVVSAEATCCASALTHVTPGAYYDMNGNRVRYSCLSGTPGCQWADDTNANVWKAFMKDLAKERGHRSFGNLYLDGGLIGGRAGDMLQLIEDLQMRDEEDDRALLTDFMFRNPDRIALDYTSKLFGKSLSDPIVPRDARCNAMGLPSLDYKMYTPLVSTETALFIRQQRLVSCEPRGKSHITRSPSWGNDGINLRSILEHVGRVLAGQETIVQRGLQSAIGQGPEIPYVIDETGVYASTAIRNRADQEMQQIRLNTTEALFKLSLRLLKKIHTPGERIRWQNVLKVVDSGVGFPFWAWFGDYNSCNQNNYQEESIPLLTVATTTHCDYSFPIPNYMTIIDAQRDSEKWTESFRQFEDKYPWNHKHMKAVWRGSLDVDDWRESYNNVRWRLCRTVFESQSDLYDVGMTSISKHITDKTIVNADEIGGLVASIAPMAEFMNYQAIIDVDGLSWSPRFGSLLCFNSVVIKVEPQYTEYFFADLIPWTHYIPVKNDLSDLHEKVKWALDFKNERFVRDIISSANKFCAQRLTSSNLAYDLLDIWEAYVTMLDRADASWPVKWEYVKKKLYASESKAEMALV